MDLYIRDRNKLVLPCEVKKALKIFSINHNTTSKSLDATLLYSEVRDLERCY